MVLAKREIAHNVLCDAFAHQQRIAIADAVTAARAKGVSRRTLTRAANDIGVREIHNGPYGAFWEIATEERA